LSMFLAFFVSPLSCSKNMGGVCWLGIVCAMYCSRLIWLGETISLVNNNIVYIVVTRDDIAQYKHTAFYFRVLSVVDERYYLFYKLTYICVLEELRNYLCYICRYS
jgi:hypothetical protein